MSIQIVKITTIGCDGMTMGDGHEYGCISELESHAYDVDIGELMKKEGWITVDDLELCPDCKLTHITTLDKG